MSVSWTTAGAVKGHHQENASLLDESPRSEVSAFLMLCPAYNASVVGYQAVTSHTFSSQDTPFRVQFAFLGPGRVQNPPRNEVKVNALFRTPQKYDSYNIYYTLYTLACCCRLEISPRGRMRTRHTKEARGRMRTRHTKVR